MIDTDEYEGHSPHDEWILRNIEGPTVAFLTTISDEEKATLTSYWLTCPATTANTQLIADAPLLLEEVKELQAWKQRVIEIVREGDIVLTEAEFRTRRAKVNLPKLRHRLREMIE